MPHRHCRDVPVLAVVPAGPEGLANGLWRLELENPGFMGVKPGQFAMLRPPAWGFDPLWARPLSISRALDDRLVFHFLVAGRGTAAFTRLAPGEPVTVWGPLGQGFAVEPGAPTLLVGGGIGIAPFVEYAATHPSPEKLALLFGHRPPRTCYPYDELGAMIAVESFQDKTAEDIPRFVELLERRIAEHAGGLVLACGPTPLLRSVKNLAARHGVRAQVSLENRMACGVGACLGCVAENPEGHRVQTCVKGPVFWADKVTL